MPITALPTPPSRQRPSTFSDEGDAFLAALPVFTTEANSLATSVNNDKLSSASSAAAALVSENAAAVSEANALASENIVLATSSAVVYNNSATYNFPNVVICTNGSSYRCVGTTVVGDNPVSSITGNWVQVFNIMPTYLPKIEDLFFFNSF